MTARHDFRNECITMQPKTFISYLRETPPSLTALFYIETGNDLYGWYLFAQKNHMSAAFFMIEHFYSNHASTLYRSVQDDVYAPWAIDYPPMRNTIRCPLPDPYVHELERMQSEFVDEWLFFPGDPTSKEELAAYHAHGIPVLAANIKSRKLNRYHGSPRQWLHTTPGVDFNVPEFLEKHWPLDWAPPASDEWPAFRPLSR
jgi:hypothetical protein